MTQVAERQDAYTSRLEALLAGSDAGPESLRSARRAAFDRFQLRGFPTTRDEEWRHTPVSAIRSATFGHAGPDLPAPSAVAPFLFETGVPHQVVVINGRFAPSLSSLNDLPAGVTIRSLREGRDQADAGSSGFAFRTAQALAPGATPFVDLNAAFVEDGIHIDVAAKTVVPQPVHVLFLTTAASPVLVSPRLVITAGEQAQIFVVESYGGLTDAASFTNAVTEVVVAAAGRVEHVKLQRESTSAFHLASTFIRADRTAVFTSQAITLGGRIARNDIAAELAGEGAEVTLDGVYVADGDSLVDTHTTIDHAMPHCPSHEVYKGILAGKARAVFNGKIIVREDAQKTDAKQTNKALLLTDEAQINTKPQLEIFADDVKCTHGAAIGQLDDDAMFYLRARGIAEDEARNMLIHAFAGDVLARISADVVSALALDLIDRKLKLT